jgi:tetratricopeptide (TPR) repeat protein
VELQIAAKAALEEAGDVRSACAAQSSIGYGLLQLGDFGEGVRALERALRDAERMGLRNVVTAVRHNLGWALARQGRLDEARRMETEAVEAFEHQLDRRLEGASRIYLARILAEIGDGAGAEREARAALDLLENAPAVRPDALATLARVLLIQDRRLESLAAAREAMALLESVGTEEGEAGVRLALAEALEATGDSAAARVVLAAAQARLVERAGRITDERLRRSFLENVPEHARTIALAGAGRG